MKLQSDQRFIPLDAWVHGEAAAYRGLETEEGDWLAALLERIAFLIPEGAGVEDARIEVTRGPGTESDPCLCH